MNQSVKTDLWGNEKVLPPKEERWNTVMKALNDLYQTHSAIQPDIEDILNDVERLMKSYDAWLD
jgi:hypothetical protein